MAELLSNFFGDLGGLFQSSKILYVEYLPVLKTFSLIISAILGYGIVYCIIKSDFLVIQSEKWIDILGLKTLTRRRSMRGWRQIIKRLKEKDQNQWKLAVMEADKILDELIKFTGVKAETTEDRLQKINPAQLSNIEEIKTAHRLSQEIRRNPDFQITHEEAQNIIKIYAQAFKEFNLID